MKKYLLFFLLLFSLLACSNKKNISQDISRCSLNNAESAIIELKEVKAKSNYIDSLTNNKKGISLMSDSLILNDTLYYHIQAGYDSELRFETYYHFYVNSYHCDDIKILDINEDEIIPINLWRKKNLSCKEKESNCVYLEIKRPNVTLPFTSESSITLDKRIAKWEKLFNEFEINIDSSTIDTSLTPFTCGDKIFKYYPLVYMKDIKIVLSPSQCGDFYQVYLLTFSKKGLKSSIYVDGLYSDPEMINEKYPILENTYFSIDEKLHISIYKKINNEKKINSYQIYDDGKIIKME